MALTAFSTYTGQGIKPAIYPELFRTDSKKFVPGNYVKGLVMAQLTALTPATDEIQTITVTATGGTFVLQEPESGIITGSLPYNVTAAALQTALQAAYGVGNVTVSGGPGATGALSVLLTGEAGGMPHAALVVYSNAVTGGAATVVVARATPGVGAGGLLTPYVNGGSGGAGVAKYICQYDGYVSNTGKHRFGGDLSGRKLSAPVVIGGYVRTADLTGIDSTAVGQLGRIAEGDVANLTNVGTILRIS